MIAQRLKGFFLVFSLDSLEGVLMKRKTSTIPKASVARILMKAGAKRVSAGASDAFVEVMTDIAMKISSKASQIAKHAGRKTVHEGDVKLASK